MFFISYFLTNFLFFLSLPFGSLGWFVCLFTYFCCHEHPKSIIVIFFGACLHCHYYYCLSLSLSLFPSLGSHSPNCVWILNTLTPTPSPSHSPCLFGCWNLSVSRSVTTVLSRRHVLSFVFFLSFIYCFFRLPKSHRNIRATKFIFIAITLW